MKCELDSEKIFIVAYDTTPSLLTFSKKAATKFCNEQKKIYEHLDWRVMNLEEYAEFCYEKGAGSERENWD